MPPSLDEDIGAIDAFLAGVGLEHGRRALRPRHAQAEPREDSNTLPDTGLQARAAGRLTVVEVSGWHTIPGLVHAFSTRKAGRSTIYRSARFEADGGERNGGELNLGLTSHDSAENVLANRAGLVSAVLGEAEAKRSAVVSLITLQQIHSGITYRVDRSWVRPQSASSGTGALPKGDGLMTNEPGVLLAVQTADCIPVLVVDRKRRAVAAFHAGWRGTLKRIVEGGIGRMRLEFGSDPESLEAAIGPGVGACCYAVGEEVRSEFESQFCYAPELFSEVYDSDPVKEKYPLLFMTARAPGHSNIGPSLHLDLAAANRRQLLDAGLRPEAIHGGAICTSCHTDLYFSYRAERGFCGRMMSVIGLTD